MNICLKALTSVALLLGSFGVKAQSEAASDNTHNGYLTILMNGDMIALNQKATIQITPTDDNKCTFLLPDLTLEGIGTIGDIELTDVNVNTDATGTTTYTKEPTDMLLLDGALSAKVSLDGTIDANGIANMTIPVIWIVDDETQIPLTVIFNTKPQGTEYVGTLDIDLNGEPIAADQPASIYIYDIDDESCLFMLPDLTLTDIGTIGDISLEGVSVSESNGVKTYTKEPTEMLLLDGALTANVSVNGTIDADGVANMTIPVIWVVDDEQQIPITVTFKGKQAAGIAAVNAADDKAVIYGSEGAVKVANVEGPVRIYTSAGVKVADVQVNGEATIAAPAGVAIVATPTRAAKVIVK